MKLKDLNAGDRFAFAESLKDAMQKESLAIFIVVGVFEDKEYRLGLYDPTGIVTMLKPEELEHDVVRITDAHQIVR